MKKVEKTTNQLVFTAELDETIANSIRRYLNHIPVMAIDEVEITKNDSALYDETIAHRLGLVPLKTDGRVTENSTGELKLDVKNEGLVLSEELKGKPEVIYKKIPITTLAKGQELQLVASVRAGMGMEHAKFSPGLMFYRQVSEITLDKEFLEQVKRACPGASIKEKGGKIVVTDNGKKEVADVCEGIAKKGKKEAEIETKEELVIVVETFGQMDVEDIFKNSITALTKDLKDISKAISKSK
jgi:DNA-directed RNA polymerase subunit D